MSLLDEAFERFTIINKITANDGYGGISTSWEDGATFDGAMVFDASTQMKVAQSAGVTSAYTLTTRRNIVLEYRQILRRESDGKIFRVTSDGDDRFTPASATLDMRQVSCEEWVLSG